MAGVHSGGQPNPPPETMEAVGKIIAPLLPCGGVEADGSNLTELLVLAVTDEGEMHVINTMPWAEVLGRLMAYASDDQDSGIGKPLVVSSPGELMQVVAAIAGNVPPTAPEGPFGLTPVTNEEELDQLLGTKPSS